MNRFTKAAAVDQITQRAESLVKAHGFDMGNGTSQLRPRGCDAGTQALIDKAVAYGSMRALFGVVEDLESGHLGVAKG